MSQTVTLAAGRMWAVFLLISLALLASAAVAEDYHEQLLLRPLPLSALLASFQFRSNTTISQFEAHNFRFFPRSLGQILQYADASELHLRFSLGRWDAEAWGARPWAGTREGGTGVELWAWLNASNDAEADRKWLTLTNALSGLFCASLNFIDGTRTTRPTLSFQPEGDHRTASTSAAEMQLLYGTLPREVVCTENLTPFLKLLPCKGKAGIASLLDGHKLFDASWQSMAIDVRPVCPDDGGECILQIEQTIDMVLDIERSKRPRDNPIPRPLPAHELRCDSSKPYHRDDTCFPADYSANQAWSLSQVFGKGIKGTCPLASPDVPPVCIEVPPERPIYPDAETVRVTTSSADGRTRCFYPAPDAVFDFTIPGDEEVAQGGGHEPEGHTGQIGVGAGVLAPETPLLYAERSLMGHGADRGGVQTILTNPSPDTEVEFVYMESLPWFMRIYLHTLEARIVDGHSGNSNHHNNSQSSQADPASGVIQEIHYRPARDRERGTQLEVRMRIPPAATVFLTYDFEKSILRYTEYPPDANRGFDVPAAVITILHPLSRVDSSGSGRLGTSNLRTTTLLLSLPTPDFSMPYNVIIFTSTAIALAFGGMFNIIVRRFVAADEGQSAGIKPMLAKLAARFRKGQRHQKSAPAAAADISTATTTATDTMTFDNNDSHDSHDSHENSGL